MSKKVVIAGYYGFENVGDDAVLTSMLMDIRNSIKPDRITVLSEKPTDTKKQFNVESIRWDSLSAVMGVLKESDFLIIGGGGLYNCYLDYPEKSFLHANHRYFSIFISSLPVIAFLLKKPCMIYGVGASEILSEKAKEHIGFSLSLADAITVRDRGTKEILKSLPFCSKVDIKVTADPAFRLENDHLGSLINISGEDKVMASPIIAVSLRNWDFYGENNRTEKAVAGAINHFHKKYGGSVLFLSFDSGKAVEELSDDGDIFRRTINFLDENIPYYVVDQYERPERISSILSMCDVAVGMRLHSVILSIKNALPIVGLVYDQKVRNIMEMAGIEDYVVDIEEISEQILAEKLCSTYEERTKIKTMLKSASKNMYEKANLNVKLLQEILKNEPYNINSKIKRVDIGYLFSQFRDLLNSIFCIEEDFNITSEYINQISIGKRAIPYYKVEELRRCINNQQFEEAIERCTDYLETFIPNSEVSYLHAFALQSKGENKARALEYYQQALELGFSEFWVRYNRGLLLGEIGRESEAQIDLKRAVELDETHKGAKIALQSISKR